MDARCCQPGAGIRQVRPVGVQALKESFENQGVMKGNTLYLKDTESTLTIDGKEEKIYLVIDGMLHDSWNW